MNVFAKFDEIPSMILEVIKETTLRTHGRSDNVKTVCPPTNTVCVGYKNQRTSGPVNAHLISWPSKAQNIQNLESFHKKFGSDQQSSS